MPYAQITIPAGASFKNLVALKGKPDIGDQINKRIVAPLANANKLSDMPDFNDDSRFKLDKYLLKLGEKRRLNPVHQAWVYRGQEAGNYRCLVPSASQSGRYPLDSHLGGQTRGVGRAGPRPAYEIALGQLQPRDARHSPQFRIGEETRRVPGIHPGS